MDFKKILSRLTGISVPVFGVSWNPSEREVQKARRVVTQLEDRRVLYNPSELEVPEHCVQSIIDIRRMLSAELESLDAAGELGTSLSALRAACRKFLDGVGANEDRIIRFADQRGHYASWQFMAALGELRGVFGLHLAKIGAAYGLDIEDDLASILPAAEDANNA